MKIYFFFNNGLALDSKVLKRCLNFDKQNFVYYELNKFSRISSKLAYSFKNLKLIARKIYKQTKFHHFPEGK